MAPQRHSRAQKDSKNTGTAHLQASASLQSTARGAAPAQGAAPAWGAAPARPLPSLQSQWVHWPEGHGANLLKKGSSLLSPITAPGRCWAPRPWSGGLRTGNGKAQNKRTEQTPFHLPGIGDHGRLVYFIYSFVHSFIYEGAPKNQNLFIKNYIYSFMFKLQSP